MHKQRSRDDRAYYCRIFEGRSSGRRERKRAEGRDLRRGSEAKAMRLHTMIARLAHRVPVITKLRQFLCLLLLVPLAGSAYAQVDQGAITGVVSDSSGAVIPNAQVTLTSTDSGLALQRQTNESGVYVFSPVKIGNYKLSATAAGFATTTQENLHLDIQQRLNLDLKLQPGAAAETVNVTTGAPLLQTEEASVGQVIDTQTIN